MAALRGGEGTSYVSGRAQVTAGPSCTEARGRPRRGSRPPRSPRADGADSYLPSSPTGDERRPRDDESHSSALRRSCSDTNRGCNRRRPRLAEPSATQRRVSPPRRSRRERLCPARRDPTACPPHHCSRLFKDQTQGLAEIRVWPQGWGSKNKINLFRSLSGTLLKYLKITRQSHRLSCPVGARHHQHPRRGLGAPEHHATAALAAQRIPKLGTNQPRLLEQGWVSPPL